MAAPNYTEDLTDIIADITSTTGWTALGGGASGLGVGADFAMQGSNAVDKQITAAEKGMIYNNGSAITNATGIHFYVWIFLATPGLANTLQLRGLTLVAGTATGAYVQFHIEGNDTYGAAGRVARCYPVRYLNTSNTFPPYRTLNGSPGANPQYFGSIANITASVKGANLGISAIRYGTGAYITAGDSTDPATFSGFQVVNDNISNRWGIFTLAGGSYELQGKFAIGRNNAGTATLCYFNDSNTNIIIPDTIHTNTDFSEVIIDHSSTECYWNAINISALGDNNKCKLTMVNMSVGEFTSCNFTDIGTTQLHSNAVLTSCVWLGTDQVDANGATLTGCTISNSTSTSANASALLVASATEMSTITACEFVNNNVLVWFPGDGTYFDASDAALSDPNSAWINDSNIVDGLTTTFASSSTLGSETTNYLQIEGTNVTILADDYFVSIGYTEDGLNPLYTDAYYLPRPSGGWTLAKVQALEFRVWNITSISTGFAVYEDGNAGGTALLTSFFYHINITSIIHGVYVNRVTGVGHSIELTGTGSYNFTDINFTRGWENETTGADVYNNSGGAVTINIIGGTAPTVRNGSGASTVLVVNPVTTTITVQNTAGTKIQNARVLATAASGGDYPFEESVTITRSGSTASVSHTAHGMVNGDKVVIQKAVQNEYNGVYTISNVTTNAYDYTVSGTPTTPATGTITSTTAIISGLTDINGEIADTRTYSVNQPLSGRVRKSTSAPYYKTADVVGTVNKDNGLSLTIVMLSDE